MHLKQGPLIHNFLPTVSFSFPLPGFPQRSRRRPMVVQRAKVGHLCHLVLRPVPRVITRHSSQRRKRTSSVLTRRSDMAGLAYSLVCADACRSRSSRRWTVDWWWRRRLSMKHMFIARAEGRGGSPAESKRGVTRQSSYLRVCLVSRD